MYLKEITLQTNNISALNSFYSDILELPVTCIDEKIIAVIVGQSKLIFEENNHRCGISGQWEMIKVSL